MNDPILPIPYGRQQVTDADIAAVTEVLRSDYLTTGPRIAAFELAFAAFIGSTHAVAVANGTAALHLSVLALGIKPGQKVISCPLTFAASTNCVLYAGGEVDLVDIDPETLLMDLNLVEEKLASAPEGTYAGIVAVDFAGYPIRMDKLRKIADKYGCWILEDSCHAPGGYFIDEDGKKQYCGNGAYADLAIFSFHPVKHIATGEGGMITTRNEALAKKLEMLRTHGITRDRNLLNEDHGGWYYEMQELGFNYRLSDIHAALGLSQLKRIDSYIEKRRELASVYTNQLTNNHIQISPNIDGHGWHLYVIQADQRKELYDYLRGKYIYPQIHYIPVHYQPYYQKRGWKKGDFPHTEAYYERCLSIPLYPGMTEAQQQYVIAQILDFYEK